RRCRRRRCPTGRAPVKTTWRLSSLFAPAGSWRRVLWTNWAASFGRLHSRFWQRGSRNDRPAATPRRNRRSRATGASPRLPTTSEELGMNPVTRSASCAVVVLACVASIGCESSDKKDSQKERDRIARRERNRGGDRGV